MKFFIVIQIFLTALIFGCHSEENFKRSEILMGTVVSLEATGKNSERAINESFVRLKELEEKILGDKQKIELAAGNGDFVQINPEVYEILEIAQKFSALTDGNFDITVGAAVELWENCRDTKKLPTQEEIIAAKNLIGFRHLILRKSDCSARLEISGMKINFGGVAKGYGVDLVKNIFESHGIKSGLIDFGNSTIFALGEKKIGLRDPDKENDLLKILNLRDEVISTSGDYEKFFVVDNRRVHHIIDPKTAAPADNGNASVSVVLKGGKNSGTIADILSTAIFVGEINFSGSDIPPFSVFDTPHA